MDLSSKVLREVEFRDRLRGYDTDEVDEFLEKVAVAVDEMQEKMQQLTNRAERAERSASERSADEDDDSIRRTLVLAQRTADLAVKEAQDQATAMTESARAEADKTVAEARENAQRIASEAERRHRDEVARLENQRDQVRGELTALTAVLEAERKRLAEALNEALRFVERTLTPSEEFSDNRPSAAVSVPDPPDDLEAQINEDAAAAAPSVPPSNSGSEEGDVEAKGGESGRKNLAAVPSLADSGPDTEALRPQQLSAFSQSDEGPAGAKVDAGSRMSRGTGSDWTA